MSDDVFASVESEFAKKLAAAKAAQREIEIPVITSLPATQETEAETTPTESHDPDSHEPAYVSGPDDEASALPSATSTGAQEQGELISVDTDEAPREERSDVAVSADMHSTDTVKRETPSEHSVKSDHDSDVGSSVGVAHEESESQISMLLAVHKQTALHKPMTYKEGREFTTPLKIFPVELVRILKGMLVATGEFEPKEAAEMHQSKVVVGYLVASLGIQLSADDLDDVTLRVIAAFQTGDPLLARMSSMAADLGKQSQLLKAMAATHRELRDSVEVLEVGQGYLLAERTGTLDTQHVTPATLDLIQKKALDARRRARQQTEHLLKTERAQRGRPIR